MRAGGYNSDFRSSILFIQETTNQRIQEIGNKINHPIVVSSGAPLYKRLKGDEDLKIANDWG